MTASITAQRIEKTPQGVNLHLDIVTPPSATDATAEPLTEAQNLCGAVIREKQWIPSREPQFHFETKGNQRWSIRCQIDLTPPVSLPASLRVKVSAPPMAVPQPEEMQAQLQALQLRFAEQTPVERPAAPGDILCVDWFGTCEGALIPQSARAAFYLPLIAGDKMLDPHWIAQLSGQSVDATVRLETLLPKDFEHAPWQGKTAQYQVYIRQVLAVKVPPIALLPQLLGLPDEETLLQQIHDELREVHQREWHRALRYRVLDQLLSQSKVPLPKYWVEESLQAQWEATDQVQLAALVEHLPAAQPYLEAGANSHNDKPDSSNNTPWAGHMHLGREIARDLRYQLLLQAVARREKLRVSDTRLQQALIEVGAPLNLDDTQVWETLQKDGAAPRFLNQLLLDHTERYLVEQASIDNL